MGTIVSPNKILLRWRGAFGGFGAQNRCPRHRLGSCIVAAAIWGFPKIRGTILGVPIMRTIVFGGSILGPLVLGNYHLISLHAATSHRGPSPPARSPSHCRQSRPLNPKPKTLNSGFNFIFHYPHITPI